MGKSDGVYCFVFKSHANKRKEEWGANLPNLPTTWVDLCIEGILVPGHVSYSFLRQTDSPKQSTFDPVASFVSAVNLHRECPPTLLKALANSHPDQEIWLESYREENMALKVSIHIVKLLLESIAPFAKKARLKPFLLCAFQLSKRTKISSLFAQNRGSLSWAIMKTAFGVKAIDWLQFFVKIPFAF